jgi:ATP-dependent protease HslVU (ClpYQ) peptidase subunit
MTTIVGVQHKNKCVLGADNQVTDDDGRIFRHKNMVKISQLANGVLLAGAGEVGACDIAQHLWKPPRMTAKDKADTYHFVISKLIPSLRECLKNNGYNFDEERPKNDKGQRFHFLIAVNGEIFDVSEDLSVCQAETGFYGVGNGSGYALGALHAGANIQEALKIAEDLDVYTSGPFLILEQKKANER